MAAHATLKRAYASDLNTSALRRKPSRISAADYGEGVGLGPGG